MGARTAFFLSVALLVFSGCSKEIVEVPDKEEPVKLSSQSAVVKLRPVWVQEKGALKFYIRVNYFSEDWIFIQAGKTLVIRSDGKEFFFRSSHGSVPNRKLFDGGGVSETADYSINRVQMLKVLSLHKPTFSIIGVLETVEIPIPDSTMEKFRRFAEDYMH